ncbi:hypothetical protein [Mameliella alba]|uniref:hypothetical protein n=1 Tax=Mameliella alba TaxID=561184 RepID=UPI000B5302F2|nr:hypothetical protein [Mameliella alba]MBY6118659.1 hypothetical protein [Mameliella alba]OWV41065.1 hypothetical protein CDZ95_18645 [Mameliella alba]OWV68221.1 hypothetical protein CDZ97_00155 [Mameliella alba]
MPAFFAAPCPFFSLAFLALAAPTQAADITILNDHPEGCHAMLSGQIVDEDTDRLRAILPPGQNAFDGAMIHTRLCLDNPGGSFPEGLDLAADLGETGISTQVAAQDSCLSTCALAFLGGTQFWVEDGLTRNRSRSMHVTATLGYTRRN